MPNMTKAGCQQGSSTQMIHQLQAGFFGPELFHPLLENNLANPQPGT
jgi:hypothetical protein